ncbi:MAG: glutaredoxin family protein [Lysobacteraceae bacterium]
MVQTSPRFVLYQRDDCHLCELALTVLAAARLPTFESVFIDEDPTLEARFGSRVPVLREDASGAELDWPFGAAEVVALYARASSTPG